VNNKNNCPTDEVQHDPVEITSVAEEDFSVVLDILESAFPDMSRSFFYSLTMRDPWYKFKYSLIARRKDDSYAHVQIFNRILSLGGGEISFGGIGSVATRPENRGCGYASMLLKRSLDVMHEECMAGSFLFTSIQPFYEKLGWRTIKQTEQDIAVDGLTEISFKPQWIRPMKESDIPELQAVYRRIQKRNGGGIIRTEEYWRARSTWLTHLPVVIIEDDEILGYFYYAQYDLKEPILTITEYGLARNDTAILERTLRMMARKAEELKCHTLRGFFMHDPFWLDYLSKRNLITGQRNFDYLMWNNIGDENLFDMIQQSVDKQQLLFWTTDAF
jgi:predicted N-acetyltransferase YhbS